MTNLPLRGAIETITPRERVTATPGFASISNPGVPVTLHWEAVTPSLLVWLDRASLEATLSHALGEPVSELTFDVGQNLDSGRMGQWRQLVTMVAHDIEHGPGLFTDRLTERYVQRLLAGGLLAAARHSHSERLVQASERGMHPRKVRQARDWIKANASSCPDPDDVARALNVSGRAMRRAFRTHLGTPPAAYIRQARLEGARMECLAAAGDPQATVAQIAQRWGFGHPGRFSAAYLATYGELPSVTLRRSTGRDGGDAPGGGDVGH